MARVLAEIDEEVRRRRRELPTSKERELDALFLLHAPMGARYGDIETALRQVDKAAFIDPVVPVESQVPAGAVVKKGLRSLSLWYVGYVTHQVSEFASAVSRTLHIVDERLAAIQRSLPPDVAIPVVEPGGPGVWWAAAAVDAARDVPGRVLHVACGDGWLVRDLRAAGADAYGVDPRPTRTAPAELEGMDLREEGVLDHVRSVGRGVLGGAVLSGVVAGMDAATREHLVSALAQAIHERGTLVVHSLTPAAWTAEDAPAETDLAPGRPVRAGTWSHLLESWHVEVALGPTGRDYLVIATR